MLSYGLIVYMEEGRKTRKGRSRGRGGVEEGEEGGRGGRGKGRSRGRGGEEEGEEGKSREDGEIGEGWERE